MIIATKIIEKGGTARKGNANSQAEGEIDGNIDCIPNGSLGMLAPTHQVGTDSWIQQLLMNELIQGRDGYCLPNIVSWGSSDSEFVRLDCVWMFDEFIIIKKIHSPTVPEIGQRWDEYTAVPFADGDAIKEFSQRAFTA